MNGKDNVYVGIDSGSESHEVCVLDGSGQRIERFSVKHSGGGLEDLVEHMAHQCGGDYDRVKVAIEVPRGAVVETLLMRGCRVFAINPKKLDRFRDRYSVAGAKDDRRDAFVLADSLRTDERAYRLVKLTPEALIRLRELCSIRNEVVQEERRFANQLRDQLLRYYPQVLKLSPSADDPWLLDLLEKSPAPERGAVLPRGHVTKILRKNHIRRISPDEVVKALREPSLSLAPGVQEAASNHVTYLVERLRIVQVQKRRCEKQMDQVLEEIASEENLVEHRDVEILQSMPGAGRVTVATMLAEASELLQRRDYHALRLLSGVAPVTKASGKYRGVYMRYACNQNLRTALYHWARVATQQDMLLAMLYKQARERGRSHGTSLRIVGDRLLAVACAALRHRIPYDQTLRLQKQAA